MYCNPVPIPLLISDDIAFATFPPIFAITSTAPPTMPVVICATVLVPVSTARPILSVPLNRFRLTVWPASSVHFVAAVTRFVALPTIGILPIIVLMRSKTK